MRRLAAAVIALTLAVGACAGETFVEYRGTVSGGDEPGHYFAPDPNPVGRSGIRRAQVTLRVCTGSCRGDEIARTATADDEGHWGPLDATFGGLSNHQVLIQVTAPGYQPYTYAAVYEETRDPTAGEQWLNVVLVPER